MQFLEQNLQGIFMQKQAFQMELSETLSAISEIEKAKDSVYKVIGQLMIKISKEKILEELNSKEKLINTRLNSLQNQEEKIQEQIHNIREELISKK